MCRQRRLRCDTELHQCYRMLFYCSDSPRIPSLRSVSHLIYDTRFCWASTRLSCNHQHIIESLISHFIPFVIRECVRSIKGEKFDGILFGRFMVWPDTFHMPPQSNKIFKNYLFILEIVSIDRLRHASAYFAPIAKRA